MAGAGQRPPPDRGPGRRPRRRRGGRPGRRRRRRPPRRRSPAAAGSAARHGPHGPAPPLDRLGPGLVPEPVGRSLSAPGRAWRASAVTGASDAGPSLPTAGGRRRAATTSRGPPAAEQGGHDHQPEEQLEGDAERDQRASRRRPARRCPPGRWRTGPPSRTPSWAGTVDPFDAELPATGRGVGGEHRAGGRPARRRRACPGGPGSTGRQPSRRHRGAPGSAVTGAGAAVPAVVGAARVARSGT